MLAFARRQCMAVRPIALLWLVLSRLLPAASGAPIHAAAFYGDAQRVEALLGAGADANARDENASTPLHNAAWNGHKKMAELLLENGADVNAEDAAGLSPLQYAGREKHVDVVRLLWKRAATGGSRMPYRLTALLDAGAAGHLEDGAGNTPVRIAAQRGHHEVIRILREHNADE